MPSLPSPLASPSSSLGGERPPTHPPPERHRPSLPGCLGGIGLPPGPCTPGCRGTPSGRRPHRWPIGGPQSGVGGSPPRAPFPIHSYVNGRGRWGAPENFGGGHLRRSDFSQLPTAAGQRAIPWSPAPGDLLLSPGPSPPPPPPRAAHSAPWPLTAARPDLWANCTAPHGLSHLVCHQQACPWDVDSRSPGKRGSKIYWQLISSALGDFSSLPPAPSWASLSGDWPPDGSFFPSKDQHR